MKRIFFVTVFFLLIPLFLFANDGVEEHVSILETLKPAFHIIESIADLTGIFILLIGFLKGIFMFVRLEVDRLLGKRDYEEIFSLRNILGSYIIISLDFLIVSDIIHSVLSPTVEELTELGIIVVIRTAIGFFLGKELHELRKELKEEAKDELKELH